MPIRFYCGCGTKLSAPDGSAGKYAKCPTCGTRLQIPEKSAVETEIPMPEPQPAPPPVEEAAPEPAPAQIGPAKKPVEALKRKLSELQKGIRPAGIYRLLKLLSFAGLGAAVAGGLVVGAAGLLVAVRSGIWWVAAIGATGALICLLFAWVGYQCSRAGLRWLERTASVGCDRTLPQVLGIVSILIALLVLGGGVFMAVTYRFYFSLIVVLAQFVCVLASGALWLRPETLGVSFEADWEKKRWALLENLLALVEIAARIWLAVSVMVFGLVGAASLVSAVVGSVMAFARRLDILLYEAAGAAASVALAALAPFVCCLAYLLLNSLIQVVRIWAGTEENTRRPAEKPS